jgi:predicted DNA-binding transcriptional regulator AlpA
MPQANHTGPAPLNADADLPRLERFLLIREVEAATGLKSTAIYSKMKVGEFPRQIRLASKPGAKQFRSAWVEREIVDWQQRQIAERDRLAEAGLVPGVPARLLPAARERAREAAQRARERKTGQRIP